LDLKSTFILLKILYAGYLGIYPAISAQFTLKVRVAVGNREKLAKNSLFWEFKVFQCYRCWCP